METMLALTVVVVIAVLAFVLSPRLNRKTTQKIIEARDGLRARASALPSYPVGTFLSNCGLLPENEPAARMLLSCLADLLNVAPEKLASDYPMGELFVFSTERAGQESTKGFEPLSYDLVERVASLSDKRLWERRWEDMPGLPRNEDALADFILQMSISEFLRFFAPLMKGGEQVRSISEGEKTGSGSINP